MKKLEVDCMPPGWKKTVLPKYEQYFRGDSNFLQHQQKTRWMIKTGEQPDRSHFTLIVPVHNEQHALPGFLTTLALSDIPPEVRMRVILITNACTDSSSSIVNSFVESMNQTGNGVVKPARYVHLDIPTPGKANALTIGNKMCVERGDKIAMCIDSDVLVEPDAIRNLYARANEVIDDQPEGTVLVNGLPIYISRPSAIRSLYRRIRPTQDKRFQKASPAYGCAMAWSSQWIESIGGIPPVANEDYAMSVVARFQHHKIDYAFDANVWQYTPNSPRDIFENMARMARCVMQIKNRYPEAGFILRHDRTDPDFIQRVFPFLNYIMKRPLGTPIFIARALLNEAAIVKGKMDYRRNPANQSWVQIKSTK